VGGLLLIIGLYTRFSAAITCVELAAAYILEAVPRGVWPLRNGGNETLMYIAVFLFLAVCGAGALSLDSSLRSRKPAKSSFVAAGG
jgi:putative oxidoreductase